MIKIRFVEEDGTLHNVESALGDTLMYVAITNNVPGIDGDCGGKKRRPGEAVEEEDDDGEGGAVLQFDEEAGVAMTTLDRGSACLGFGFGARCCARPTPGGDFRLGSSYRIASCGR